MIEILQAARDYRLARLRRFRAISRMCEKMLKYQRTFLPLLRCELIELDAWFRDDFKGSRNDKARCEDASKEYRAACNELWNILKASHRV